MHQAANQAGQDPDRISFIRSLRVVRRQVTGQAAFSPADSPATLNSSSVSCHRDAADPTPRHQTQSPRLALKRATHRVTDRPAISTVTIVNASKPKRVKRTKAP
ncbi:hypothetical protein NKH18_39365 [Streptomyces sp. M10(2022)]